MSYIYRFWHTFRHPSSLTLLLEKEEQDYKLQGYQRVVVTLLLLSVALFAVRDVWGMYTFRLTDLLGQGQVDQFIFARYMSVIGALLMGVTYFLFHYIVVAYLISVLTDLPFKWIQKVQVYVITVLLAFKFLEFLIFSILEYTTLFSPFSFAAIVAQWTTDNWILFFVNQLSIVTFITVVIQYIFLVQWDAEGRRGLLAKLIAVQLLIALIIAFISISPLIDWLGKGLS